MGEQLLLKLVLEKELESKQALEEHWKRLMMSLIH